MINEKLKDIPKEPGCYLFKDEKQQIIYVGMSKFLPKRVSSYFQKTQEGKTKRLVENIRDVEFKTTSSEQEALLLEEELIKLYKPLYNIKGKDDKSRKYSICLTNEDFPKLEIVRNKQDDRVSLDFTSGFLCRETYDLLYDIFELRNCTYQLTQENIEKEKFKVCLEYHLGRCNAPCVGNINKFEYGHTLKDVKRVLNLETSFLMKKFKRLMKYHSDKTEFEVANDYLNKTKVLEKLEKNLDVVRIHRYSNNAYETKKILGLKNLPITIEAFDNSHNQGDSNVAASVRFSNDKPVKSEYRKYIIRSFEGINDYASFDEVLTRRFKRLIEEKQKLPDLVIIDGGKGQLNVAIKVFQELGLTDKIDLISLSKDNKHKTSTIHLIDGSEIDIMCEKNFTTLSKIQEEVHRFAINFHRKRQTKKLFS